MDQDIFWTYVCLQSIMNNSSGFHYGLGFINDPKRKDALLHIWKTAKSGDAKTINILKSITCKHNMIIHYT